MRLPGPLYLRVRAVSDGAVTDASNEILVNVPNPFAPPSAPVITAAAVTAGRLKITWTSGIGGPADGHRADFFAGGSLVASITSGADSALEVVVPPGIIGTFAVVVTASNFFGSSPPSAPLAFTIGEPPGLPAVTAVSTAGGVLTVGWTLGPGTAPTGHRLDFFQDGAFVTSLPSGSTPGFAVAIPPGLVGDFTVVVTAIAGPLVGPSSAPAPFTIGSPCGVLAAPIVSGGVAGATASAAWPAVAGAIGYVVSAGTAPGATNILPPTNVGAVTAVGASGLPAGFQAWVRVVAVNACGQFGPPADHLVR